MRLYPKSIWIVFMYVFFLLALGHIYLSTLSYGHFQAMHSGSVMGLEVVSGLSAFSDNLNKHIDKLNHTSFKTNILAALGYIAATATAYFSYRRERSQQHPAEKS